MSKQHLVGVFGTPDLLLCPRMMGRVNGQGWQSHRPGRESAGCICSWLCLCSKREPQALFLAPQSLVLHLLNDRKLIASKSTLELSATGIMQPLFPQLPKVSSTAARPTLSSGKGLPSSLSFILWAAQVGWGCSTTSLPGCSYAWWEQPLAEPCGASPGPTEHVKQNKHPEKRG